MSEIRVWKIVPLRMVTTSEQERDKWIAAGHEVVEFVSIERIAKLEAELAQSQAALKMAREWSKGDKWRFSEVAQEYAAWENYFNVLNAAIKEQQDHIPNVGKMVQSQAQQEPVSNLNCEDISLIRQWFNAVQDLNPKYLNEGDFQLLAKLQSQAQQTESKPVMPVGFLDHGGIFYSYREKIKDGTELYVKPPAPEVCSDGGKCGAGGYCITCPNMPAPEGE